MASGEGQSNPSTSGDAGGDHNEDFGNEYGLPLPTQEELREMEHRRLVGEATNLMLNFAKDPKLAKYMSETAFQDVQAQWKATTTSSSKPESKKQYIEKKLKEEIDARLARILGAQKQGKKHDRKRKKSTDFPGYLGSQSTFDKAKKHKKRATMPSSSSSFDSSSESSEEERRGKKRSKKHRHGKGQRKTRKSKSRRIDDSSIEDTSTGSTDSEDGHFYANKNFYKANQYDFQEDKSKKVREFKEGGQSIKFETFSGYKDASKALSFIQQFDIAFARGLESCLLFQGECSYMVVHFSVKQDCTGKVAEVQETFHLFLVDARVRIEGQVEKVSEKESDDYFHSRPWGSQIGAIVSAQSEVVPGRQALDDRYNMICKQYADGGYIPRPDCWGGFRLRPVAIEFWQGRESRLHDRLLFTRERVDEEKWSMHRLAP
ncbi:hypothetical protein L7F22_034633 [Adiantum nelumboides]|nr:hypothetical protein [Adiantum nelumboides]